MPRYSLSDLIARANAGQIGYRGLNRLQAAGVNPTQLAASGVASPLNVDPQADLNARRAVLYGRALQSASQAQPGQTLSAAVQHRLSLGPGGQMSGDTFAPHTVSEVQGLGQSALQTAIESLRKRGGGIASSSNVYRGF